MRSAKDTGKRWDTDLAVLELRHRRGHDLRATFITLAEDDGAERNVIEQLTHTARSRSAYAGYSRTQWGTLCRELVKLKISRTGRGDIIEMPLPIAATIGATDPAITSVLVQLWCSEPNSL
jgi:hypothetical protein